MLRLMQPLRRRFTQFLEWFLARHPGLPANDATASFFLGTVAFTIMLMAYFTWVATGALWADMLIGWLFAGAYVFLDAFYADSQRVSYRNRIKLEAMQNNSDEEGEDTKIGSRSGEHIGFGFVSYTCLLSILVAAGVLSVAPPTMYFAAGATAFILIGSSALKSIDVPTRARLEYDNVIKFLCYVYTAAIGILVVFRGLGGPPLPWEVFAVYTTLLSGYASHGALLAIIRPDIVQRRAGHAVATLVFLFVGIVFIFYFAGIFVIFPLEAIPFGGITAIILWLSVRARFTKVLQKVDRVNEASRIARKFLEAKERSNHDHVQAP